jgi:NAD(P)H-flavin reductase
MTWQLGIVTDRAGHVHLGAVVAGSAGDDRCEYVDLLAPVGAGHPDELDLEHLTILVRGQDLAALRQLAEQCIANPRLRSGVLRLTQLSTLGSNAPASDC